jgi:bacillopeptidase F
LNVTGTGVVVANIDTGVDWQHPALQTSYRGYNPKGLTNHLDNWFDATGIGAQYPVDGNDTAAYDGTMVGRGGMALRRR